MSQLQKIEKDPLARPLEAAKWLQIPMLLSVSELQDLFTQFGEITIVKTLAKVETGKSIIPKEDFFALYADYIAALKAGSLPDPKKYRSLFSSVLTLSLDALYAIEADPQSEVIKVKAPIVQMQYHTMTWSKDEGKFRSQLFGKESVPWGLIFSYPQIILDPMSKETIDGKTFPNSALFQAIKQWQKGKTVPTPFVADGKRINASQRIGKECLEWINNHPSLKELNLYIETASKFGS